MRKKNGAGGIRLPDFRLYYKATVIKTVWSWHENRNMDHWNKIESPEINPCTYGYLIFDKEARIYNGAKTASSINGVGKTGTAIHERMKIEHFLTPYTKINVWECLTGGFLVLFLTSPLFLFKWNSTVLPGTGVIV